MATVLDWPLTAFITGTRDTDGIDDTTSSIEMTIIGTMIIIPHITRGMSASMLAHQTPTVSGDFVSAMRDTPSHGVSAEMQGLI